MIILNLFWMWNTSKLIALDTEMQDQSFNPFDNLGLSQPAILRNGFNTPEVKKTYRSLARKYHPDKVRQAPEVDQPMLKKKWQSIVRSYETLTNKEKFNNWIEYGNPDGSMTQ